MTETRGALDALDIRVPTLVVDRGRALANLERMAERARLAGVRFRPHFKTHRSHAVGDWFRDVGVRGITVSSVRMAQYFASAGWSDITIAFPLNVREVGGVRELSESVRLGVLVDSVGAVGALARAASVPVDVWLKVDAGYGRAGVGWDDTESLVGIARRVSYHGMLRLAGLLTHNGLTYRERSAEGVRRVHAEAMGKLISAREALDEAGLGRVALSVGDTPSASLVDDLSGADEIRPGNFVFNDLTQAAIGSCALADVAVAVVCPVVGVHTGRRRVVLYGGAVHLSAESLGNAAGRRTWGLACPDWPEASPRSASVTSLSQEHAVVEDPEWLEETALGNLVAVLPVHSCLACAMHGEYLTTDGERLKAMRD